MTDKQGKLNIAVVGATGLVGEAMLEILAERGFPIEQLHPLASERSEASTVEFSQRHLRVRQLADFDFRQVQLSLFCVPPEVARQFIPEATAAGSIVIDVSEAYRLEADVPLVVAGVNAAAIGEFEARQLIACPDASSIQLALGLIDLHRKNPLERVNAVLMRAVSEMGRAGIDELSAQSIALFNLKEHKPSVFTQQIAFNVLPCSGGRNEKAGTLYESHLQQELQKILEDPDIAVNVSALQMPVFFGHAAALQIEFKDKISTEQTLKLLRTNSRIRIVSDASAVTDAAKNDQIFISRVRQDPTWERGLNMWSVMDNVRAAAINGVLVAEILVKDYL